MAEVKLNDKLCNQDHNFTVFSSLLPISSFLGGIKKIIRAYQVYSSAIQVVMSQYAIENKWLFTTSSLFFTSNKLIQPLMIRYITRTLNFSRFICRTQENLLKQLRKSTQMIRWGAGEGGGGGVICTRTNQFNTNNNLEPLAHHKEGKIIDVSNKKPTFTQQKEICQCFPILCSYLHKRTKDFPNL